MTDLYMRHDSFIWDVTHSYMRRNSFIHKTRLIHIWDMTHSYMRHDSFIYEMWLIHTWDKTRRAMQEPLVYMDLFCINFAVKDCHVCVPCPQSHVFGNVAVCCMLHEKLLGIKGMSNPSNSIDPGSLKIGFLVPIQNAGFVRDYSTN